MRSWLPTALSLATVTAAAGVVAGAGGSGVALSAGGAALGGIAGNEWHRHVLRWSRAAQERYVNGYTPTDENHVVLRECRLAQLGALRRLAVRFEESLGTDPDAARRQHGQEYAADLRRWLDGAIGDALRLRFTGTAAGAAEIAARQAFIASLPEAVDDTLAARRLAPADLPLRRPLEEAVLAELRAEVWQDLPPGFIGLLRQDDGWFDLFIRDAARRLKDGGEFERIWNAEQVAAIKRVVDEIGTGVAVLGERIGHALGLLAVHGAELDMLRADVAAMRAHVAAIERNLAEGHGPPLRFAAAFAPEGLLRFAARNMNLPFLGRQAERDALDGFLHADRRFVWWLVTGAGGAGKTRLAIWQCIRARALGWNVGFLAEGVAVALAGIAQWQPARPTLIVADYATRQAAAPGSGETGLRELALALAEREAGTARPLPHPVRLLLLDREAGPEFERRILGTDMSARGVMEDCRHAAPPLALPEMAEDELWELVRGTPWRAPRRELAMERAAFFARLDRLDAGRRPLVAMILADALAQAPDRPDLGGLEAELRDLLRRERDHLWPRDLGAAGRFPGEAPGDLLIGFATMLQWCGREELRDLRLKDGETLDARLLPACARAVGKPLRKGDGALGALEPDLLGEFFVLEMLAGDPANPVLAGARGWMAQAAWRCRGGAMFDFARRALFNFAFHDGMHHLAAPVEGVEQSWLFSALVVLALTPGRDERLAAAAKLLRGVGRVDVTAARALGDFAIFATSAPSGSFGTTSLHGLLGDLAALAAAHAGEAALREQWAKAVFNYVNRVAAAEPALCHALLGELAALAAAHAGEAALRDLWAKAVVNYVDEVAAAEPAGCGALLNEMSALAAAHAGEAALRERWAGAVINYVAGVAAAEPAGCRALVDDLAALAAAHAGEAALREQWAKAVVNYVHHVAAAEPAVCWAMLVELAGLAAMHAGEAALREEWITACGAFGSQLAGLGLKARHARMPREAAAILRLALGAASLAAPLDMKVAQLCLMLVEALADAAQAGGAADGGAREVATALHLGSPPAPDGLTEGVARLLAVLRATQDSGKEAEAALFDHLQAHAEEPAMAPLLAMVATWWQPPS